MEGLKWAWKAYYGCKGPGVGVKAQRRVWECLGLVRKASDGCGGTRVGMKGLGWAWRAWGGCGGPGEGVEGMWKV